MVQVHSQQLPASTKPNLNRRGREGNVIIVHVHSQQLPVPPKPNQSTEKEGKVMQQLLMCTLWQQLPAPTKLKQTKPPNQTKPNQTKPNQTKPNQTTQPWRVSRVELAALHRNTFSLCQVLVPSFAKLLIEDDCARLPQKINTTGKL